MNDSSTSPDSASNQPFAVAEPEIHLLDYLNVIRRYWKLTALVALVVFGSAAFYAFSKQPIYEATTTLEIQRSSQGGVLELSIEPDVSLAVDIEILQSRTMAERVVRRLNLHWGELKRSQGLTLQLRQLSLPDDLQEVNLVLAGANRLNVIDANGRILASPRVGIPYQGSDLSIWVEQVKGQPGDSLVLGRFPITGMVQKIRDSINIREQGKNTNILQLSARSDDPVFARDVVNTLAKVYSEQSVNQKSREAGKTVTFIDSQLDSLKTVLDKSEKELQEYKIESGITSLGPEGAGLVERLVLLEQENGALEIRIKRLTALIDELRGALAEGRVYLVPSLDFIPATDEMVREVSRLISEKNVLLDELTESHPAVVEIDQQIRQLQETLLGTCLSTLDSLTAQAEDFKAAIAEIEVELKKIPGVELELANRLRDNQVNAQLYTYLLQKQQEARISQAATTSNVSIIDPAFVPEYPVAPNKKKVLLLGAILGLMLGVGSAFLRDYFDQTVKNGEQAKQLLDLPLLGVIPRIDVDGGDDAQRMLFTRLQPKSPPVEAFRALRTNLNFVTARKKKVVLITSTLPDEGKSTISVNLALVLAQAGSKVLLVGCDMRRPSLGEAFRISGGPGLSDHLTGEKVRFLHANVEGCLDFVSAGTIPPNPAELLESENMTRFLTKAREKYDYVLLDAPPVLPVTDAQILAQKSDLVLLVIEPCRIPVKALQQVRETLNAVKAPLGGIALNDKSGKGFRYHNEYNYYGHKFYGGYYG